MSARVEILKLLSDGTFHSGTDLGKRVGITRAAVCKNIQHLTRSGLEVHRIPGRGYRLEAPLMLLERARLLKAVGASASMLRDRLFLAEAVDSTNRHLADMISERANINGATCLAEVQSGGRGRRGRSWVATPYRNLMLSMTWRFAKGPGIVSGLSLAAGVAVLRALEEYGASGIGLKWPNDLLWRERKLSGLLVDVEGEAAGPTRVILGVGINCHIGRDDAGRIDQPWADLVEVTGKPVDRNRLAGLVIRQLLDMFRVFDDRGLEPFRTVWQSHHLYHKQRVRILQGEKEFAGVVEDIDASGGLILRNARSRQVFHSGEVSLRSSRP